MAARLIRILLVNALVVAAATALTLGGSAGVVQTGPMRPAAPAEAVRELSDQQVVAAYTRQPLAFVANRGQTDRRVRYLAQGSRFGFYLTRDQVAMSFLDAPESRTPAGRGHTLRWRFVGANPDVRIEARGATPGLANYLTGNRPDSRQTGLTRHTRVVYRDLWPGIDLMLRGRNGELKYEFRVAPGARVRDIRLRYDGATSLALSSGGGLRVRTAMGVLRDSAPVSYQLTSTGRSEVSSRFELSRRAGSTGYGFAVGRGYRADRPLVIDPGLDYSTFLGGASNEEGYTVAVDGAGSAYVTGPGPVSQLPHHDGRLRPHRLGPQQPRHLRHQAQPDRHRARLLHLPRRVQLRAG